MIMLTTFITRRKPARGVCGKVLLTTSLDPLEKAVQQLPAIGGDPNFFDGWCIANIGIVYP
jgi:hypothetical protein